ncbi:MAG TPA: FkbM family methyltransferase [Tepidisphaeraceae bacterium]|jgi:FkbM family methyltransferase
MTLLDCPTAAPRPIDPARALPALRKGLWDRPAGSLVRLLDYRIRITDGPNAYMQYKDVFVRGNYRFAADRPDPLIIDGGSNMGISILGFKRDHPGCRVIGFEPDPQIFRMLQDNLARNDAAEGVTLVQAGLASQEGTIGFAADGSSGGRIAEGTGGSAIRVVRLSDYLREPVDFLKLNIEGEELPVLQECADAGTLANVRKLVVEYHGWRHGPQRLGDLLNLLDREGFRYLVHDFDAESCGTSKPPFRLRAKAPWFCLVYAERTAAAAR